jgi:phi13 family phage major tail protein
MALENKVTFGLKNVYYAVATDTGTALTYGTPVAFPGASELSLDAEGTTAEAYFDDTKYFSQDNNQGYKGKLTMAKMTEAFEKDVLSLDITDNVSTERADAKIKQIALMFEFDGDKNGTRHVLYNVSLSRPGESSKTKEDKIDVNKQELSFTAAPNPYNSIVKAKTNSTTSQDVYNNWYKSVYIGTPAA